ncbi:MAG: hypothetical protein EOP84_29585, partial [Verrucomicrobiaceae bacterium]
MTSVPLPPAHDASGSSLASNLSNPPGISLSRPSGAHVISLAQQYWAEFSGMPPQDQWLPFLWRIQGSISQQRIMRLGEVLSHKHRILQTTYGRDSAGVFQWLNPATAEWKLVDLSALEGGRVLDTIHREFMDACRTPLSDGEAPLRIKIYKLGSEMHLVGGYIHHIAFDAVSITTFLRDLMSFLQVDVTGGESDIRQYTDFVDFEQRRFSAADLVQSDTAWKGRLQGNVPMRFPWDPQPNGGAM